MKSTADFKSASPRPWTFEDDGPMGCFIRDADGRPVGMTPAFGSGPEDAALIVAAVNAAASSPLESTPK